MGKGLTHGKPLLSRREFLPAARPDLPGHPAGNFVGADSRVLPPDPLRFVQAALMVRKQLLRTLPQGQAADVPVPGKRQLHRQIPDFHEAFQINAQGIFLVRPPGDVRGDVKKDMVSGKQHLLSGGIEAEMPGCMPRRQEAGQLISAAAEAVTVLQRFRFKGRRGKTASLVVRKGRFQHPGRHPFPQHAQAHGTPVKLLQRADVGRAHQQAAAQFLQGRRVAGVVRVQMGEEDVGLFRFHLQLFHPPHQVLQALRPVEAGVDQQAPLSRQAADDIAVQPLQRVFRQADREGIQVFGKLFCKAHVRAPLSTESCPQV